MDVASSFLVLFSISVLLRRRTWRRQLKAEDERTRRILELKEALAEVNTLSGMLPIRCYCKKIRDDQGCWNRLETYLTTHSEAQFTQDICPDCKHRCMNPSEGDDKN